MPYLFKVKYGDQTKRLTFQAFPPFLNLHNRLVENFGRIDGGYRVINLRTSSGIVICEVAEHEGDWASAIANYGTDRPAAQVVLRCELQPVLATPREAAELTAAASAEDASCCSVDEGKREMKTLLNNFLTDFKRAYSDTFLDELNVYEGLGTRSPATVVADLPTRSESASTSARSLNAPVSDCTEEGPLHPNIWCDRCGEHIRGVRYKCNECADYDLCGKCTRNHSADAIHCAAFDHTFKLITRPVPTRCPITPVHPFGNNRSPRQPGPVVHRNITCDGCNKGPIIGVRHKCLDCPDFDFCDRCKVDDTSHDPNHEFFALHEPGRVIVHERPMRNAPATPTPVPQARQPASAASPPRVTHNAKCNLCSSRIYGLRLKCIECPDFDVCESCHAITNEQHPNHSFVKISNLSDIVYRHSRRNQAKHRAICDAPGCGKIIHGTRYKCMHPSCKDFDLCADCEALPIPVHPIDHPLLKIKTPKTIIPQILREGQEVREKTEPVIPVLPGERSFPLPQIPVLQPLPVHAGTIGVSVIPPCPPMPVPVPIRIDSSAQTTEVPRVSTSTQTIRKRSSVASVQTSNHGEEKSVQVEAPTPVAVPRIIRIPIIEEEPRREPESPKIIVLPSVPTTEPITPKPVAPKPAAVPVPIPPRPDPTSMKIPVVLPVMLPTIARAPSFTAPESAPSSIIPRAPSPPVTFQDPSPAPEPAVAEAQPVHTAPLVSSNPEMSQTITQPASLYSNFMANRPALEPITLSGAFIEDMNVADGTTFPPGAEFIKCWKMINDGRRDWPAETVLVFVGGHRMAAFSDAPNSYDVGRAAVGQTVDVWAGDLKAPEEPGVYNSFWRLRNGENGEFFGHRLWINIEVAAPSHSGSDVASHPSLSSSELAMPGGFYEAPQDTSVPASEHAVPTPITRRDTTTSSSIVTPVTFSSAQSNDDSVSLLNDSDRDDGSLVDVPAATTTTGATTNTMVTARASSPTAEDDEWAVVYDSASSVDH